MATKRLNFRKKKKNQKSSSQKPYSLHSCIFRWALWSMGLWLQHDIIHWITATSYDKQVYGQQSYQFRVITIMLNITKLNQDRKRSYQSIIYENKFCTLSSQTKSESSTLASRIKSKAKAKEPRALAGRINKSPKRPTIAHPSSNIPSRTKVKYFDLML